MTRRRNWKYSEREVVLNLSVPLAGDGLIADEYFEESLLTLLRYAAASASPQRLFQTFNTAAAVAQMERLRLEV